MSGWLEVSKEMLSWRIAQEAEVRAKQAVVLLTKHYNETEEKNKSPGKINKEANKLEINK